MKNNLFKKTRYATAEYIQPSPINKTGYYEEQSEEFKPDIPEGILVKCSKCGKAIYRKDLLKRFKICDECGEHLTVFAYERIRMILDKGTFEEFHKQWSTKDPLNFPGYNDKIVKLQSETGLMEGVIIGKGKIDNIETMIAVMDSSFMMGSMGTVVGNKITRLFEKATEAKLPIIIFAASGGARMQEGILSLMQMAKVSAAAAKHSKEGLLYISVLTNPTTGGVSASFAMEGDIILAEPNCLIGFAGPRVIEQTIGQKLPEGFQRAEFLLKHGFIDAIIKRNELKQTLATLLKLHSYRKEV